MEQRDKDLSPFQAVPLFPLPNVVLFPRAVLPLHIFEQRYKAMTADVLRSPRREIAMALLQPGWEKYYYGKPAVEPVVCIGRVLSHQKLADGKYNFLLQGVTRATIVRENADERPYRTAMLQPLVDTKVLEIDLAAARERLRVLFDGRLAGMGGMARQFRQMLESPLPTAGIADLIAFNLLEEVALKQSLLAETDVRARVQTIIAALDELPAPPPPARVCDPSMN